MRRPIGSVSIALVLLALSLAAASSDRHLLQADEALDINVTKIIWPGPFDTQVTAGAIQESGVLVSTDPDEMQAKLDSTGLETDENVALDAGSDGELPPAEPTVQITGTREPYYMIPTAITSKAAPESGPEEPIYLGTSDITITDNTDNTATKEHPDAIMSPTHEPIYTSAPPSLPSSVPIADLLTPSAADLVNQGEPSTVGAYGEETINMAIPTAMEQSGGLFDDFKQSSAPASTAADASLEAGTLQEPVLLTTTATPTPTITASVADEKSAAGMASISWTVVALFAVLVAAVQ